jgi:ribosomal protein S18 acetylase RimI-like enzyme
MSGLVTAPVDIQPHPRADPYVEVRALRPERDSDDEPLWSQVVELWVAGRDPERYAEAAHRRYSIGRLADLRALFQAGRGAWYVALIGDEVAGSCGVVVTDGRGRFQAVDTKERHRRRGICSRLVTEASARAANRYGATQLVIAADPDYHAITIYQSLGFAPVERVVHLCLQPVEDRPV